MSRVTLVTVPGCTVCPFAWDGTDMDDEWRCIAVDLGDQFKQIRNIGLQFERRAEPPRWCPLRKADHLVTLRKP